MRIASDIDPDYFDEIKKASKKGVKMFAYSCKVKDNEITVNKSVKVIIQCLSLINITQMNLKN